MKTIQLTDGSHLINGVHRDAKSPPFAVADEIADQLVKINHAKVVGSGVLAHNGFVGGLDYADAVVEAYSPAGPDDDPTQAARVLGSLVEDHSGLQALNEAGHPDVPDSGRVGPSKTQGSAPVKAAAAKGKGGDVAGSDPASNAPPAAGSAPAGSGQPSWGKPGNPAKGQ